MALARVHTFALDGIGARPVAVEVDIRPGLPAFGVVGLGDVAVREARERVRAAVANSGWEFPMRRIVANLAPADLRKAGPGFDLALAVGILAASGQLPADRLDRVAVFGELSLGGALRSSRGTLVVAEAAAAAGLDALVLAPERAGEAALAGGLAVVAAADVRAAADYLAGGEAPDLPQPAAARAVPGGAEEPDLAEVRGQSEAVRALRIAAAGGHNLLLQGPPGTGKTMLARRLPSILPPLTGAEALEVTRIRSLAGLHEGGGLVAARPFRAPHHAISVSGLVGGGAVPAPGEATLAHCGVLFLDELAEFPRPSLEALRQPLEDGHVTIVRAQRALRLPTRVTLVAATNPCPCGGGTGGEACRCTEADLARYRRRLSGPLLDRVDLHVSVERPGPEAFAAGPGTPSAEVRAEVVAARERQAARLAGTGATCNAHLGERLVRATVRLGPDAAAALEAAYAHTGLSARAHGRVVRVARTLADLAGRDRVAAADVHEALFFRNRIAAATATALVA